MPIQVTCPGCLKRFTVNDKFAGKSGPCPSCRKVIKIPDKSEEVVIHAPEQSGPKDSTGKSVLKPLRRKEVKLSMPVMLAAGLSTPGFDTRNMQNFRERPRKEGFLNAPFSRTFASFSRVLRFLPLLAAPGLLGALLLSLFILTAFQFPPLRLEHGAVGYR